MSAAASAWTAPQLRGRFAVYGRFYDRCVDGVNYQLRSHLEIFEHGLCWAAARLAQADLVAVMMNPGGSRPTRCWASATTAWRGATRCRSGPTCSEPGWPGCAKNGSR